VPQPDILVLGGVDDYRHWTYYLPEGRVVWTKYLLYYPIREGVMVWVSQNRHQDLVPPEVDVVAGRPASAAFTLDGERAVFALPDEFEKFLGSQRAEAVYAESDGSDSEPIGYAIPCEGMTRIVFREGNWWLE
jgi:hypothetical protein